MPYPNLTRSLIALAISGVSVHASATTITLSDKPWKIQDETYDSLTVTGRYVGKPEYEGDGFDFYNSTVKGNLILDAHIETEEVNKPNGQVLNGQAFQTEDNAKIGGDLINLRHLEVRGMQAEALELNRTTINGSLINEGQVIVKGGALISGYPETDISSGIVVRETTIGKDVHNKGSISASVKDVNPSLLAIDLHGINIEGADIGGSIINSSNITVDSNQANGRSSGILIQDHKAKTDDYGVLHPYRTSTITGDIKNTGIIKVTGENAVGVRLAEGVSVKGNLYNTGTISGDTAGIQLDGTNTTLNITQAGGLIQGGTYAINQNNNTVNLTLTGGDISGKINVTNIDVNGTGTISTDEITAKQLTVNNNGHLKLNNSTQLHANLNLAGGEITGNSINVSAGKEFKVTGSSTVNASHVTADKLIVSNSSLLTLSKTTGLDTHLILTDSGISAGEFTVNNLSVNGSSTITADTVTINSGNLIVSAGNQLNLLGKNDTLKLNTTNGFTVKNGAALGLELAQGQDSSKPMVHVNGDLVFELGSKVSLSAVKGLKLDSVDYFLIQANDITADSNGLVQGTALLKVNSYENLGGKLHANVSVVNDPSAVVKATGASKNAQAAATQMLGLIEGLEQSSNLANQEFAQALLAMDNKGLAQTAEQMAPEMNDGAIVIANLGQTLISNATTSRTTAIRRQTSSAAMAGTGIWMQSLYNDTRQGTRNNIAGYNAYTSGIAIGADAKVNDNVILGAAYGYMDATVNSKSGNRTKVDGHSFSIYAGYELDNYFVDANLTYSKNENDAKRHIANTTAKGKYDSKTLGLRVLGGYDIPLNDIAISPLVGMNYSNTKLESFTEKGSPAALHSSSQRYEVAEVGVGVRLSANYPLGQGSLQPQLQTMVYHDFAADSTKNTSTFVNAVGGGSFVAYGAKPVRTSFQTSLGLDYKVGAFTVGGSYNYTGKKGFNSDTFAAKIRYDF